MLMAENQHSFEFPEEDRPEQLKEAREHVEEAEDRQEAALETVGQAQESTSGKQTAQVYAQPPAPVAADGQAAVVPAQPTAPATDDDKAVAALPAKDGDLIEKEWVDRAKHIIAKTADDPHKQKHEVSKIKAAYIQKRFNKTVKTDEAAAAG